MPDGLSLVTPYILANDAGNDVRFLEAAFGAREIGRSIDPNGRIANCQIQFATTTIMVSESSTQFPASRAAFYLYVAAADAVMTQAEKAGGKKIMDVADMPYGDRQGGVRDPSGNIWWVSQRLTADPYFWSHFRSARPGGLLERVEGIEPSYSAWKAAALPLSYTRVGDQIACGAGGLNHPRTQKRRPTGRLFRRHCRLLLAERASHSNS